MALYGTDGVQLRLPTHLDLPCSEEEVMPPWDFRIPDHTDLPDSDGEIVENTLDLPQALLLTDTIAPILRGLHPDGQCLVGGNSAIYWRFTEPPLKGAIGPDWFYVPDVPPLLVGGKRRRSYVLWKEHVPPRIVMEFVSGDGAKERDRTPETGKLWVYEMGVKADFYVIYDVERAHVEMYHREGMGYRLVTPNARRHLEIPMLGVELGIWNGTFMEMQLPWLRWWDLRGEILPLSSEKLGEETRRADHEARRAYAADRRADDSDRRADDSDRRAESLAAKLRSLGIDPDDIAGSA